ncbi:hypothetical protein [Agrobacterium rosae]|uniref:hypothetical protein n=1 Tax=Agrobacterium rosae TaxID=1972867 RepID=UPI003BA11DF9
MQEDVTLSAAMSHLEFTAVNGSCRVSVHTILQCLQIAVAQGRLPPLDEEWVRRAGCPSLADIALLTGIIAEAD